MAETLANGTVVPQGSDLIHSTGVQAMRNMGGSVDAQLGNRALVGHTHPIAGVVGLQSALDGKAPTSHTHSWAQITSKPSAFPPATHTHDARYYTQAQIDTRLDAISTAYQVAQSDGYTGSVTEWLASLVGPRGPEGPYGGTEVTDPQVASYVTTETETRAALEAAYRRSVSVAEYGATGDGTTDDTAAVQAALTANPGGSVYFPPGTYRLTAELDIPGGTAVSGADSASTLLDWSTKPTFTSKALLTWEPGTIGSSASLTADAKFADASLAVPEGHGFQVGDYLRLTSDETLWGQAVKGEYQRVLEADATALHLSAPVFDDYGVAYSARVQHVSFTTGSLRGVSIRGKGINPGAYGDNAVHFTFARDVQVSDVRFVDVEHRCVILDSVLGATVSDTHFRFDTSRTPLQYGVAVSGASQMVTVSDCSSWNDRHLFTTNHSAMLAENRSEARGIPRILTITGCTAHGSWQAPIDTHRGGEYVTIVGNSLSSESTGIKIRSKHALVSGNTVVGKRVSVGGYSAGLRISAQGDDVQVTGNVIRGFGRGVSVDTPDLEMRGLVLSENQILDCDYPVSLHFADLITDVRIAGNILRATESGNPIQLFAPAEDLNITGNTLVGGHTGIICVSANYGLTDPVIRDNVFRGQSSRAAYLLNVSGGLVTGNIAEVGDIRFHGAGSGTRVRLNSAPVTDTSSPGIYVQDFDALLSPSWSPVTIRAGYVQADSGFPLGYSLVGRTVRLRGRVARSGGEDFPAGGSYAISIPVAARPGSAVSQSAGADGVGAVVDIATNGVLNVFPDAPTAWVSLDGVTYDLA